MATSPKKKNSSSKKPASPALRFSRRFEDWELRSGHPAQVVVGVDEVGRGCLAGPVVAGAVVLPEAIDLEACPWLADVNDSKKLTPEARERLAPLIRAWAAACAVAEASVEEIDRINIYHASHLAMTRAIDALGRRVEHILVDGNAAPKGLRCPATAIVKGDGRVLSIACASILAKVHRDHLMQEYESRFPGYGFGVHKGYSTPIHSRALKEKGACEIHRRSFGPVAEALGLSATGNTSPGPAAAEPEDEDQTDQLAFGTFLSE